MAAASLYWCHPPLRPSREGQVMLMTPAPVAGVVKPVISKSSSVRKPPLPTDVPQFRSAHDVGEHRPRRGPVYGCPFDPQATPLPPPAPPVPVPPPVPLVVVVPPAAPELVVVVLVVVPPPEPGPLVVVVVCVPDEVPLVVVLLPAPPEPPLVVVSPPVVRDVPPDESLHA